MKTNMKGLSALALSATIYGSFGVMIRLLSAELDNESQVVFRYGIALVILSLLILVSKTRLRMTNKEIVPMLIFAGVMQFSIMNFTKAATLISVSSLLGTFYIGSIITSTLLAIFLYKEKFGTSQIVSTLLALAGLYILSRGAEVQMGMVLAVLAGSSECISQAIRKSASGVSKGVTAMFAIVGILVVTLVESFVSGIPLVLPTQPMTWLVGGIFGIIAVVVNISVTYGFRNFSINLGSIIMSSEIGVGAILGMLVLKMSPTPTEIITISMIALAILVQNVTIRRDNKAFVFIKNILEN